MLLISFSTHIHAPKSMSLVQPFRKKTRHALVNKVTTCLGNRHYLTLFTIFLLLIHYKLLFEQLVKNKCRPHVQIDKWVTCDNQSLNTIWNIEFLLKEVIFDPWV